MLLVLYSIAMLACFLFLARIVDLFFISSLDKISNKLKLSSDVAGATLMAAGSSAPELFVALFSVLKPGEHQGIGIGSIVGSALFNILVIVGIASIVRKSKLTWQPILRDLIFYLLAVGLLVWGIWDGNFSLTEAIAFLIIYGIYVIAVLYWKKILPYTDNLFEAGEEEDCGGKGFIGLFDRLLCKLFPAKEKYYLIFFISIVLIAASSWVLVELAVGVSEILHIPEVIIALTVIAIGTSVPDLISSVIVAKQGRSDMAVSNAIGSNIFDILVGLGLPFLIVMIIDGGVIDASTSNLFTSSIILFASVIFLFIMLVISKWKVGRLSGIILLLLYILYLAREILIS